MSEMFKAALVGRVRNGYLQQAASQLGGIRQLAEHLGLRYAHMVALVNMSQYPSVRTRQSSKWRAVGDKLLLLTGVGLDDVFPVELNDLADRPLKFAVVREVPTISLQDVGRVLLPPSQEAELLKGELNEGIDRALKSLTPRQEEVLNCRFGLGGEDEHTLAETGQRLGITAGRVRMIEAAALRKLRHPSIARPLASFLKS